MVIPCLGPPLRQVLLIRRTLRVLKLVGAEEFPNATENESIESHFDRQTTTLYR